MKVIRSKCCKFPIVLRHSYIDYKGEKSYDVTAWHECIKCGKPTDIIEVEVSDWVKESTK